MKAHRKLNLAAFVICLSATTLFISSALAAVTIGTVPIGNVGNTADSAVTAYNGTVPWDMTTNLGAVNYAFNMGKTEVTAAEYTDFLNAVAATDTYGLYSTSMANPAYSGITRSGSSGAYTYAVNPANANGPAQFISFWSATRFANWMHNGQPVGLQGPGTTESGSYRLTPSSMAGNAMMREPGATWVVPCEDEWYKAAYFNGSNGTYWTQPTRNNSQPGNNLLDPFGNNANLAGAGPYPGPINGLRYTTDGGQFFNSYGHYGTYDMAGNVYEWNEGLTALSAVSGLVGRGLRGGSFGDDAAASADRSLLNGVLPTYSSAVSGFRLALLPVPEPSSMALLAVGGLALAWRLRGRMSGNDAPPAGRLPLQH